MRCFAWIIGFATGACGVHAAVKTSSSASGGGAGTSSGIASVTSGSTTGTTTSGSSGSSTGTSSSSTASSSSGSSSSSTGGGVPFIPGRTLVWSDEFDGAVGAAPDPAKRTYETGATGWGNNELENYTNARANSYLDGSGHLVIEAVKTGATYTSARLITQGLFTQQYGRFEARLRAPADGAGVWPACWSLGSDIATHTWPSCGEIDIFEQNGASAATTYGTAHGPKNGAPTMDVADGGTGDNGAYTIGSGTLGDDFHTYAVEWTNSSITWYVDDNPYYYTFTETEYETRDGVWVFNTPFYILLNIAVGGNFVGTPPAGTVFPQQMIVDHVRVYAPE